MRTKIIAANWKMNTTLADAHVLADGVREEVEHLEKIEIILCPPTIWLTELARNLPVGSLSHLMLGAQNMYTEDKGAFTGETSPLMIKEVAEYVILGHSERVSIFKENPELIADKVRVALEHDLKPIVCIGEEEQEPGSLKNLVHRVRFLLNQVPDDSLDNVVVAYEPVWAIGTGKAATPEYAEEVIATLRTELKPTTRILYGGSVTEVNAKSFLEQPNIDGLLIGGTSLKLKSFVTICQIADQLS